MISVHIGFFQGSCWKKKPRLRDEDLDQGKKNPARYKPLHLGSKGAFSDIWTVSLDGCECHCHIKGDRSNSTSVHG